MKSWPFLLLCALLGCTQAPQPQAITRIVLSRNACDPRCTFAQYVIYPDGRVRYTSGLQYTYDGRMPPQSYRALAQWLVKTPAFGRHSAYGGAPAQQPISTIWVDYGGKHAQVMWPTQGLAESYDPNIRALEKWARLAQSQAQSAILRERHETVARLRHLENLERVVFDSRGCFGTCPAFVAEFSSDGTARIRNGHYILNANAEKAVTAYARVPFSRVRQLLAASGFAALDPEYPVRTVDVYGVSFEFDYRDGYSYSVLAPDETQWPPEVASLEGAFNQLVRDTDWIRR
jgi:hypothetical protein